MTMTADQFADWAVPVSFAVCLGLLFLIFILSVADGFRTTKRVPATDPGPLPPMRPKPSGPLFTCRGCGASDQSVICSYCKSQPPAGLKRFGF